MLDHTKEMYTLETRPQNGIEVTQRVVEQTLEHQMVQYNNIISFRFRKRKSYPACES